MQRRTTPIVPVLSLALPLALAAAFVARSGPVQGDTVRVAGVLVDAEGAPVTGAEVAASWWLAPLRANEPFQVDGHGRFTGELEVWGDTFGISAYASNGALAGYASVAKDAAAEIRIVMRPSVRVIGKVTCSELGTQPLATIMWSFGDYRIGTTSTAGKDRFEVPLPQGEVTWWLYDTYFSMDQGELKLDGSQPVVDFGTIDLPASFIQKNEGKVLPAWTVTEARGVAVESAQIASYRGKWLLIEFWGHW